MEFRLENLLQKQSGNVRNLFLYCDAYGDKAKESLEAQKQTILNYCKYKGINCVKIFENTREDVSIDPNGDQDLELGEEYKAKLCEYNSISSWHMLWLALNEGVIDTILVDNKKRLYSTQIQKTEIEYYEKRKNVRIVELFPHYAMGDVGTMFCTCTIDSMVELRRVTIIINTIDSLHRLASQYDDGESLACIDFMYGSLLDHQEVII
jgi:hypothetical protein